MDRQDLEPCHWMHKNFARLQELLRRAYGAEIASDGQSQLRLYNLSLVGKAPQWLFRLPDMSVSRLVEPLRGFAFNERTRTMDDMMSTDGMTSYRGGYIATNYNDFSGKWGARIIFPGESQMCFTPFFADDERTAINDAKGQIDRSLAEHDEEQLVRPAIDKIPDCHICGSPASIYSNKSHIVECLNCDHKVEHANLAMAIAGFNAPNRLVDDPITTEPCTLCGLESRDCLCSGGNDA